jgi:flagellar biosynthesis protein FlhG
MRSEDFEQVGTVVYLEKKKAIGANSQPKFWAIASGKGGVGRSFFTSSLGISLSRSGYRVLMVDCDYHGGTLHSWMGAYEKDKNISDYYRNIDGVENYFITLGHEKLCMLAGDTCVWNCDSGFVRNFDDLLEELRTQPFDVILLDLAQGCDQQNVEILKKVDETFLLTTPEGASIERTYRWIENYIMKIGLTPEQQKPLCEFNQLRRASVSSKESLFRVRDFLETLRTNENSEPVLLGPIKLLINQVRNFEDERLGESIKSICNKFYFTDVQAIGSLQYDNAVWQCARQRVPVLIHQPFNPLVGQIQGIVKQLVDQPSQRAVV